MFRYLPSKRAQSKTKLKISALGTPEEISISGKGFNFIKLSLGLKSKVYFDKISTMFGYNLRIANNVILSKSFFRRKNSV